MMLGLAIPLARISAFVSPYGEIKTKIPLNIEAAKTFNLISPLKTTLYRIYGEYTFLLSIIILIIINKLYIYFYKENRAYEK